MPITSIPMPKAVRTTALMQAFMPGLSPPLVNTPMRFMAFSSLLLQLSVTSATNPSVIRTKAS